MPVPIQTPIRSHQHPCPHHFPVGKKQEEEAWEQSLRSKP